MLKNYIKKIKGCQLFTVVFWKKIKTLFRKIKNHFERFLTNQNLDRIFINMYNWIYCVRINIYGQKWSK
jgi:hypothetical protein